MKFLIDLVSNSAKQFVFGKRLGQVLFGTHDAPASTIKQAVLARQHNDRRFLEHFVVLDQRTRFVAIEPRHHDVNEDDIGPVIGNLGQRIEPVNCRKHLATFLRQQSLGCSANGFTVVHDKNFEPVKASGCVPGHRISPR